ncbi:hypothetical protein ACFSJY_15160 [Thalassotalea euphylliae]|uniref:hypothetical protein n=1 Tax=Thalassotalea euphylliae TaxID=1655234 RepID=UPI00362D3E2B
MVIFIVSASLLRESAASADTIYVMAIDYPPFVSESSPNYGFTYALLEEHAKQHFQVSIKPLFVPPGRAQAMINAGDWCLSFYPPIGREQDAEFIPLLEKKVAIKLHRLKQDTPFTWQTLSELSGKSVAVLRAQKEGPLAMKYHQANLDVVPVESIKQGLEMMVKGRVDYWAAADIAVDSLTAEDNNRASIQSSIPALQTFDVGVFYHKKCHTKLFKQ